VGGDFPHVPPVVLGEHCLLPVLPVQVQPVQQGVVVGVQGFHISMHFPFGAVGGGVGGGVGGLGVGLGRGVVGGGVGGDVPHVPLPEAGLHCSLPVLPLQTQPAQQGTIPFIQGRHSSIHSPFGVGGGGVGGVGTTGHEEAVPAIWQALAAHVHPGQHVFGCFSSQG
jgi:hypothetical protein